MGKPRKGSAGEGAGPVARQATALVIAERGIRSSGDFRELMSRLMTDVIQGSMSPEVTNAACNAGGKLLKMMELEYKYATAPTRQRHIDMAGEIMVDAQPALQSA